MSTLIISAMLGSALLHAIWNVIIKGGTDTLIETAMKNCGGAFAVLFVLPFLPFPLPASWPYLAVVAFIHLCYYLCIAYSYRGTDLSYVYTVMRGSAPLLTALVTVLVLHEAIGLKGWAGVLLLSCGVLVLAVDSLRRGVFRPVPTMLAVANAFVIMAFTVVDGTGVRLAGNAVSYACWEFLFNAIPIATFTIIVRKKSFFHYAKKRWYYGLGGGMCSVTAYGISLWAITKAPIAEVTALRETSVVFGALMAVIFLKEKMTPARIAAVLLVVCGAVALKL